MGIFALALLATAGYGVQKSMKSNVNLSGLALSNVEALAQSETTPKIPCDPASVVMKCTFVAQLADGTYGMITLSKAKNRETTTSIN